MGQSFIAMITKTQSHCSVVTSLYILFFTHVITLFSNNFLFNILISLKGVFNFFYRTVGEGFGFQQTYIQILHISNKNSKYFGQIGHSQVKIIILHHYILNYYINSVFSFIYSWDWTSCSNYIEFCLTYIFNIMDCYRFTLCNKNI